MDWITNLSELILVVKNLIFFLETGKIYNHINESSKELAEELTKKSLIDNLLDYQNQNLKKITL